MSPDREWPLDILVMTDTGVVVTWKAPGEPGKPSMKLRPVKVLAGPECAVANITVQAESTTEQLSPAWRRLRRMVLNRDRNTCQACRVCHPYGRRLTVHHIVSRRDGGNDALSNLIALCEACHNLTEGEGMNRQQIAAGAYLSK